MVSHRSIGISTLCLFARMALVTVSFWGWFVFWMSGDDWDWRRYLLINEFLLVGVLFGSGPKQDSSGPYKELDQALRKSLRQCFVGFFGVFLVISMLQDSSISRIFLLTYLPWLYFILLYSNYWLPRFMSRWAFSGDRKQRVALVGTLEKALRIKPWLERKNVLGLDTVGILYSGPGPVKDSPFPVLGAPDQVEQLLREHAIGQLIVMDLSFGSERMREWTQLCESTGVRLLVLLDLNHYFNHTTTTFEDEGLRFIGMRDEPLESPVNRFLKRLLDLAVAIPAVVLILPFSTLLVWILHRLQSPGPVFFIQTRVGMMGHPFRMVKYRTMHVNNGNEAQQASKGDPRVFPAGSWLRKLSIDELPQFLNVLYGNMSVVGPRPHLAKHEEMFIRVMKQYLIRKYMQPGLTGWAQVSGFRGEIHCEQDIQKRVEADIHYLENWSFGLDCVIILKTIKHCVFPPRSAY